MKKIVCLFLVFLSLLSVFPASAERFVFRDNIRWGMSSELVQLFEDFTELNKEKMFSWLSYEDVRVSTYTMTLEYQFVDNKLVSIIYYCPFKKNGKSECQQAKEKLTKAYISKYGNKSSNVDIATDCMYQLYTYLGLMDHSKKEFKNTDTVKKFKNIYISLLNIIN